ncbi:unnamed protein product [Closterium sp. Naga37s-1]|nr:unnamed protein product [Closterium sp. Naga37s-1]
MVRPYRGDHSRMCGARVEDVWSTSGGCVEHEWRMCGARVEDVWSTSGGCVEHEWRMCGARVGLLCSRGLGYENVAALLALKELPEQLPKVFIREANVLAGLLAAAAKEPATLQQRADGGGEGIGSDKGGISKKEGTTVGEVAAFQLQAERQEGDGRTAKGHGWRRRGDEWDRG